MSFADLIKKIKKSDDRHKEHYVIFTEIIGKLQPIAFLISASLVLAVFFKEDSISQKYALFASLSFFLSYLGFASYRIFNYRPSFYWGLGLTLISAGLLYYSFADVLINILSIKDTQISIFSTYIVYSMVFLIVGYFLDSSNKNNCIYKISNYFYYIAGFFTLIYVPIGILLNLPFYPLSLVFLLLLIIMFISLSNSKETKKRREDEDFSYQ